MLSSGRAKLLRLALVSAAYSVARDDLVSFGYDVLDSVGEVGEGSEVQGEESLGFL